MIARSVYMNPTLRYGEHLRETLRQPVVPYRGGWLPVRQADLHYLGQRGVGFNSQLAQAHFALIDAARNRAGATREQAIALLRKLEPPPQVSLPWETAVVLKANCYRNLGDPNADEMGYVDNPVHDVTLPRDFWLLPLTVSFLSKFGGNSSVTDILNRGDNATRRPGNLVGHISLADVLALLEFANPALLSENVYLRLPSEAAVEVLIATRHYSDSMPQLPFVTLLTASRYRESGVVAEELDIDLDIRTITHEDLFALRPAGLWSKRASADLISRTPFNSAVLEVLSLG